MTADQSIQTAPCVPPHRTPSPPPDTLYGVFEDTIATIGELVFPVDPEISSSILDISSQDFLEDILDQLIRWGVDIYGRSGSLRIVTGTIVGDCVYTILEDMQDELEIIQLQAERWQKTRGKTYMIRWSTRQMFLQVLVNLRGFNGIICKTYVSVKGAEETAVDGLPLPADPADSEEGEIVESIEETDGACDSLFVEQR